MSILIKGMEMPQNCMECPIVVCLKTKDACPLVPVPPHGRLIDADALGEFPYNMDFCDGGEADEWVRNAPTIIPAEGGGE